MRESVLGRDINASERKEREESREKYSKYFFIFYPLQGAMQRHNVKNVEENIETNVLVFFFVCL